jgi:Leucine-rich repeat (LRR) protein
LRKLKLLDNNIAVIQGLENLRVLEELSLEKNKLQGI